MVCYSPLVAWRSILPNADGKRPLFFNMPSLFTSKYEMIHIPCGQCIGCRLDYSRQWAVRCVHEAKSFKNNIFITLTYDDEHMPWSVETGEQTLVKKHFQDFMKRLRKIFTGIEPVINYDNDKLTYPIRYYMCGEYGEETHRPHYHAILFNFDFPDKVLHKISPRGDKYYISDALNKLWGHGYCIITDVTFDSCAYVARYVMKKVKGEHADDYYRGIQREYVCMSRRPGIARRWYEQYKSDVYPYDEVIINSGGKIRKLKPPRYYDNLFDLDNPEEFAKIKEKRMIKGKKREADIYNGRLKDKEKYKLAQIKSLKRRID